MITIEVNNQEIQAGAGETILAACARVGISIPTLCHLEGLKPSGACRMCVVEVEGYPGLITACSHPVAEGMKIQTHSPRALNARKVIVELLLANHPDDCLYCCRNQSCDLQSLAEELGVRQRRYANQAVAKKLDVSSPSIIRDPAKCILCGKCIRVCEEIQGVGAIDFIGRGSKSAVGTAFDRGLNVSSCINCGQCIMVCPTGALTETPHLKQVINALADPELTVVVQHAPAISVSLAEEFGLKPGLDAMGAMTTALRRMGFARVFDTSFTADLTIMEEAAELIHRVKTGGPLPLLTSCSPGWVKYVEQFSPEMIPNVSTCKSPQQMLGAVIKTYWAEREKIDPQKIFSVAVMPCTAKKFECSRPGLGRNGNQDIDAVLTTRELAQLIRMRGLDLSGIEPSGADTPFGERSSAGKLFGASGGVMEAALRTGYHMLTGKELPELKFQALRGMKGVKEATVEVGDLTLSVAVASGLGNAKQILDDQANGKKQYHFIEVMTCPGGCIAGGGQPLGADPQAIMARMKALYKIDRDAPMRTSHNNPAIKRLYRDFLEKPLSPVSHRVLHTEYAKRDVLL